MVDGKEFITESQLTCTEGEAVARCCWTPQIIIVLAAHTSKTDGTTITLVVPLFLLVTIPTTMGPAMVRMWVYYRATTTWETVNI